jgi:hypothetical protein
MASMMSRQRQVSQRTDSLTGPPTPNHAEIMLNYYGVRSAGVKALRSNVSLFVTPHSACPDGTIGVDACTRMVHWGPTQQLLTVQRKLTCIVGDQAVVKLAVRSVAHASKVLSRRSCSHWERDVRGQLTYGSNIHHVS